MTSRLPEALTDLESVYEAQARLQGFAAELDYVVERGLTFEQWRMREPPAEEAEPFFWVVPEVSEVAQWLKAATQSRNQ